jgi:RNase P protein component
VVVAKPTALTLPFAELCAELRAAFEAIPRRGNLA